METYKFVDAVYKHYGVRSVNAMYNKCMELLDTIQMGFQIRDFQHRLIGEFMLIGENLVRVLRQNITKQVIQNYLQTKEIYQITTPSVERKSFNWTVVENRCIKWQMDSVYLGEYLLRELGWTTQTPRKKQTEHKDNQISTSDTHGIVLKEGNIFVIYIHPEKEWQNQTHKQQV